MLNINQKFGGEQKNPNPRVKFEKVELTGSGADDVLFHFSGKGLFEKGFVWTRKEMEGFLKIYTWMQGEYDRALAAEREQKGL